MIIVAIERIAPTIAGQLLYEEWVFYDREPPSLQLIGAMVRMLLGGLLVASPRLHRWLSQDSLKQQSE